MKANVYLIQKLSIEIQKGNAASVLGSLPTGEALKDINIIIFIVCKFIVLYYQ